VVSTNATPPPDEYWVISTADQDEADRAWSAAAAEYVDAVSRGHRDLWIAGHFPHLPDATHQEILSDLWTIHFDPRRRLDVVCRHCGRLWRQNEPGSSEQKAFAPEP
jgi:hypothetical protein